MCITAQTEIRTINMSDILSQAAEALNEKLSGGDFDASAKFEIEGLGAVILDASGARVSDDAADVTLSADADTFQSILSGELNPTSAFMTGKLSVDGDMGIAMKLASVLA
jgi:putative sterol carrier protein